jgi:phosphatidylinositol alpha-mannosyltransferase
VKIAITSLYLPAGSKIGVGHVVHYLANDLVQRGHEVTVFSQCGASSDSLYKVVQIPSRKRLATFGFAWDLRGVDFTGFDVLNAHGDDWFLWGKKRPRHVHTFHGSCFAEMLHSRSITQKVRMAGLALCETESAFLGDFNTTVSESTRRYVPRINRVIPNGVSLNTFEPVPENEKEKDPTILFVGSMHGRKRGDLLMRVFREQIKPQIPNAKLWAVSDGPEDGGQSGEEWMGRIPLEQLRELFRRAWVFCLPSSYEGFGVPYIEALASGTPVVATPNDGAREVLNEGEFGAISPDEKLGETLIMALQNETWRRDMRAIGLERAQEYSWDRVTAQYLETYQS